MTFPRDQRRSRFPPQCPPPPPPVLPPLHQNIPKTTLTVPTHSVPPLVQNAPISTSSQTPLNNLLLVPQTTPPSEPPKNLLPTNPPPPMMPTQNALAPLALTIAPILQSQSPSCPLSLQSILLPILQITLGPSHPQASPTLSVPGPFLLQYSPVHNLNPIVTTTLHSTLHLSEQASPPALVSLLAPG